MDSILVTFGLLFVVQGAVLAGFGGSYTPPLPLMLTSNLLSAKRGRGRLLTAAHVCDDL